MDNFKVNIICQGRKAFNLAIKLGMSDTIRQYQSPEWYLEDKNKGLVFFWTDGSTGGLKALPKNMTPEDVSDFAWGWLKISDYGEQPDHDGGNGKGFQVYNDNWGQVEGYSTSMFAVKPAWAMYGK